MEDNWIIENLTNALNTWNEKLTEIWQLVSMSPQEFKGGDIWQVIVGIHGALQAVGYGLLVLFVAINIFRNAASFRDLRRPEQALHFYIRFVATKTAITYGMDLLLLICQICNGIVSKIAVRMGSLSAAAVLPEEIKTAIADVGFLASIPLWVVTLLGTLFITVLSFLMILIVYGRFFRLFMYTALAPIPLSSFGGEGTSATGKAFLKSYIGVCMEGAIIVLACMIYSAFVGSGTPGFGNGGLSAVTMVWMYLGEMAFNMLVLVGLIKNADRVVKEMMAL